MGRPSEGFLWFHPGIASLTIPYHDTNDFYFSGHVGTCLIHSLEMLAQGETWLLGLFLFILAFEYNLLMVLFTHYIIDLISGAIIAWWAHQTAETLSYYLDTKLPGWGREERKPLYHEPCPSCGWSNPQLTSLTDQSERVFLKNIYLVS